jgi:hypothetical protein
MVKRQIRLQIGMKIAVHTFVLRNRAIQIQARLTGKTPTNASAHAWEK